MAFRFYVSKWCHWCFSNRKKSMRKLMIPLWCIGLLAVSSFAWAALPQEDLTKDAAKAVNDKIGEVSAKMNQSQTVQEISAGLLDPIYQLAEYMGVPWFYWAAFALMAAGVVSFALQLVLTKLLLLAQLKMNLAEIFSDALGLLISLVGLVLTTQAATQNSTFTASPAAVVSSAAVGLIAGFVFYLWGQRLELRAAARRTVSAEPAPKERRGM
jgi:hypothetical protein